MRILALTWKHPLDRTAGGAERYLVEVCRRWVSAGNEVTIFGPRLPAHLELTEDHLGVDLAYVGKGSRLTVFPAARRYLRAKGHLYDRVLETVSTRPFAAHRIVGDKAVALYYQTAEEVWTLEYPLPIALLGRHFLEPRWVGQMCTAHVVAISASTALALQRFGVNCLGVVPPGCDAPETLPVRSAPGDRPRLLWIGRLVQTKRPNDALAALALVRNRIPGATLDLVGGGYLQAQLATKRQPGVTIHGPVSEQEKRYLLAQTDILLVPGTREGWGIVAMEAAAYGVPVVAYDVAGLRDAVVDRVTGVLVPPNTSALAAAACEVLTERRTWHRLSVAARQRALSFSWDRCASDLLRLLLPPGVSHPSHTRDSQTDMPIQGCVRYAQGGASIQVTAPESSSPRMSPRPSSPLGLSRSPRTSSPMHPK